MKLRALVLPVVLSVAGLTVGTVIPASVAAPLSNGSNLRAVAPAHQPIDTSENWSGYVRAAQPGTKFTDASARWTVPRAGKVGGFSSTWVGIDGFLDGSLIQTGTDSYLVNGKAYYLAWWEILPADETLIALTVSPGDTMSAFVQNTSGSNWLISITDVTTKQSFSINKTYIGPGTSAEWIQEAPSGAGMVLPLGHYGETEFWKLTVGTDFAKPTNARIMFPLGAIAMVQNGRQVSTPSRPTGGDSFNVAYGRKRPPAP